MLEDERTFGLQMFVKPHPAPSASEHSLQCRLAHFERFALQVITVQLNQVEGVHEAAGIVATKCGLAAVLV